jgi:hypothetical protein
MGGHEYGLLVSGMPYEVAEPGATFGTIEEAAVAALVHARETANPIEREALSVGSIVRTEGGYTWQEPQRSASYFRKQRPRARVTLTSADVATYVVHPRTGEPSIDRRNERVTRSEKRIVDEVDPLHRPMCVLTPRGRIVTYGHGTSGLEIADVRWGRVPKYPSTTIASR